AVYEVEARLTESHGHVQGLERAIATLVAANEATAQRPKLWPYMVWGSVFLVATVWVHPAVVVGLAIYGVGFTKYRQFRQRKAQSDQRIRDANLQFDQVVVTEITPRNEFVLA